MGLVNCAALEARSRHRARLEPVRRASCAQQIGPGEVGRAVPWNSLTAEQKQFQPIKMAIHAAMIHRMDIEIGRVLEQLKAMGAFENTVIFFLSDNGASAEQIIRGDGHDRAAPPGSAKTFLCIGPGWSSAANTPFRLHKSWVHEGGITTPLIVHWPQGIAARGELRHNPGHLIDLAPTILELAGGKWPQTLDGKPVPPPPGKSLVPAFAKDGSVTHDYFWWYHIGNRAIRVGDWKLVAAATRPGNSTTCARTAANRRTSRRTIPTRSRARRVWTRHMEEFRACALRTRPRLQAVPAAK